MSLFSKKKFCNEILQTTLWSLDFLHFLKSLSQIINFFFFEISLSNHSWEFFLILLFFDRRYFVTDLNSFWMKFEIKNEILNGLVFGNKNQKMFPMLLRKIWFNIITKIISDKANYPSSMSASMTTNVVTLVNLNILCKHRII